MSRSGYNLAMSKLFRDVEGKSPCPQGSVVCIGAFDGLHVGHRALVGHVRQRARVKRTSTASDRRRRKAEPGGDIPDDEDA